LLVSRCSRAINERLLASYLSSGKILRSVFHRMSFFDSEWPIWIIAALFQST
jgi:hypothetical protein